MIGREGKFGNDYILFELFEFRVWPIMEAYFCSEAKWYGVGQRSSPLYTLWPFPSIYVQSLYLFLRVA